MQTQREEPRTGWRGDIGIAVAIALLVVGCGCASRWFDPPPSLVDTREARRIPSPDGKIDAVLVVTETGALGEMICQVHLVRAGCPSSEEDPILLTWDSADDIPLLHWKDSRTMGISTPPSGTRLKQSKPTETGDSLLASVRLETIF